MAHLTLKIKGPLADLVFQSSWAGILFWSIFDFHLGATAAVSCRQNTAIEIKFSMCKCLSNSWGQGGPVKCWGCEEEEVFTSLGPCCRAVRLSLSCNTCTLQRSLLQLQQANDTTAAPWCSAGPDLEQLCWCLDSLPGSSERETEADGRSLGSTQNSGKV